jgi:SAM-dependent methyltransferase
MSEEAQRNRSHWDAESDAYQAAHGEQLARHPMAWGVWSIPEESLRVLADVQGKDVLEFGCGAAQWSIALAKLGARCVALDNSERQLYHACANMTQARVDFPLIHANAEDVPLPSESFDIVFCDHGAMSFAAPERTVPEAARLLRRGGLLAFSSETPLHFICWNKNTDRVEDTLRANYFEQNQSDDGHSIVFSRPYGAWIALFRQNGLAIEDLIEIRPPQNAESSYDTYVTYEWARQWPAEHIWRVRKS